MKVYINLYYLKMRHRKIGLNYSISHMFLIFHKVKNKIYPVDARKVQGKIAEQKNRA